MSSFLKIIDVGLQALIYTKFEDILELESIAKGVHYYPKEISMRENAEKEGGVELEFVNVWRTRTAPSWQRQNTVVGRRGLALAYTDETQTDITNAKAMPVDLGYEVTFWTNKLDKLNEIAERYLFWQHSDPNLNLNYLDTYPAELDLHFGELIDDSTIREKYQKGTIWALSAPIRVDGWVFVSETIKSIQSIKITCYDATNVDSPYTELYVDSDSEYDETKAITLKLFSDTIVE